MQQVFKLSLFAAVLAGAMGAAQAETDLTVNLSDTHQVGADHVKFKGSFTYDGVVYGPATAIAGGGAAAPTAHSIDLRDFTADTLHNKTGTVKLGNNNTYLQSDNTTGGNVVYRVYRQEYAGVVGNLTKGTNHEAEDRIHFVKAIVGDGTARTALPSAGSYGYEGVTFSNFGEGTFNYVVDLANNSGSGSFSLDKIMVPGSIASKYNGQLGTNFSAATSYNLDVTGTLNSGALTADSNGVASLTGSVTAGAAASSDHAKLYDAIVLDSSYTPDPNYYVKLYGPQAEELAGALIGLPERIGGVAIIGKRSN
ncbi:factor H binding protein domain-containing protein [Kerstersia sp.]|uniref:factor H binding protein domain-containing protein n=1 Tax=Kerstersia sp. TaxID=1930783 RepID=UPI003F934BA7